MNNKAANKKIVLVTSIGKKVQLIKHLRKSFKIIGVDASILNPCKYFVDKFYKIPKVADKNYICELLKICEKENVELLIPLHEGEFSILNSHKDDFKNINTTLLLSSSQIINVCKDKFKTSKYFTKKNIKNPKVYTDKQIESIIVNKEESKFPLFIKPADGMGSNNAFKINNIKELIFFKDYVENGIIQKYIKGIEYTVDTLVDFKGRPVYVIPRIRLEVRSGEVVKSKTVKDKCIINETVKILEALNELKDKNSTGAIGPITIQFFKTDKDEIYLLEINPRFGGGVPLSFECGADYGKALSNMLEGREIPFINDFNEKTMLRFDDAVFIG
ncbi:ATP-grasp domain-containing protein [uncultured Clostridium sp.]|uniref:ATP-grasp domain-containing protein n=1 Tax=uncultured Clostridium sp. TaxID=59620 RepID=UPI0025F62B6E|nr:ATP-grasp domain-containing protein [uncultured Clostridium sp.]